MNEDHYRRRAAAATQLAQNAPGPIRALLLEIAQVWMVLAMNSAKRLTDPE